MPTFVSLLIENMVPKTNQKKIYKQCTHRPSSKI